ncbi:putative B3 domain-containing protein-like [Capsicum annuum]|nr:putative B3 domain-containing protein-like [Capsicum annuum]
MGNEKANIYCEAELPPNYDRVGIEISSLQSMRIRGGSLRMRRRFKKGGPQGDNNDIVTEVVMGISTHEKVSPGEGALPHQTSQMTQPIAVAESVKQVAEVVNPPKVDIATDLFDMLSMDSPNDNGASAASVDDNSWRAFQPVEEELATKSGVAKADHRKCQSSSAIDGLFKDSSTLSSSISTSSLSDKPPKDVKNDIMNLFDKIASEMSQTLSQNRSSNPGSLVLSALYSVTTNSISRCLHTQRVYLQYFENMVSLNDQTTSYPQLEIENDERYSRSRVLTLRVHPPHSSTNTICLGIDDLSISLWDMRIIGGHPLHRTFFDEVVPSAQELTQADQQGKPFLPKICAYLFSAFYRLSDGASREVSVHDWLNFWFKGLERYKEPPPWGYKTTS